MKSKRIQWLDFAKGFTILCVVLAHCVGNPTTFGNNPFLKYFYYLIFIMIMPIFFSISGYLYKDVKNIHDYLILLYKKSTSLLIPYFIISSIYFLYKLIAKHHASIYNLIFGFRVDVVLWFLFSLYLIFIIVGLFDLFHINRYVLYAFSIMILLFSGDFWRYTNDYHLYHPNAYLIYSYLIFFCLGMLIKQHSNFFKYSFTHNKWIITYLILLILFIIFQLNITSSEYQNNIITISNIFTKILSVFASCCVFINLNQNSYLFKYFTKYGKYTLIIYLVHYPFELRLAHIIPANVSGFIILSLVSWMFSIIVCYLSTRISVINFIFYPRSYINKLINFLK